MKPWSKKKGCPAPISGRKKWFFCMMQLNDLFFFPDSMFLVSGWGEVHVPLSKPISHFRPEVAGSVTLATPPKSLKFDYFFKKTSCIWCRAEPFQWIKDDSGGSVEWYARGMARGMATVWGGVPIRRSQKSSDDMEGVKPLTGSMSNGRHGNSSGSCF